MKNKILNRIKDYYLSSKDFNGFPIRMINSEFEIDDKEKISILRSLITEGNISLNFGDIHENAYIKAYPEEPLEIQIKKLNEKDLFHVCAYPSISYLAKVIDKQKYSSTPFTLELALGKHQLSFFTFDTSVLEIYRNDPRYSYSNDDISGSISIKDEFYHSNVIEDRDKILLQTFGYSLDSSGNRYVTVALRYLSYLSAEHQQIWNSKVLVGEFGIHPDYYKIITGSWDIGLSIFKAFALEMQCINELCKLIGRPQFFLYQLDDIQLKSFGFLIRPTLKEYNDFILCLDKLLSENINKRFFQKDISLEKETERKDGKILITQKSTIKLLDEWLDKLFQKKDEKPHKDAIATLKEIRKLRQAPAHKLEEDEYNTIYFEKQRKIIEESYRVVQSVRLILSSHPKASSFIVPEELENGKIWLS